MTNPLTEWICKTALIFSSVAFRVMSSQTRRVKWINWYWKAVTGVLWLPAVWATSTILGTASLRCYTPHLLTAHRVTHDNLKQRDIINDINLINVISSAYLREYSAEQVVTVSICLLYFLKDIWWYVFFHWGNYR